MTGRQTFLMQRGIDAGLFSPVHRSRRDDGCIRLGFVGRLSTEKNVRVIAEIARTLRDAGRTAVEVFFIGEGSERGWLEANVPGATFTGILRGEDLSRAYADLDVFLFPSRTDTFGNVILEALASGVPCVVTGAGGPKFLVEDGVCGLVAGTDADFVAATKRLVEDESLRLSMRDAARAHALKSSWDAVFDEVYGAYRAAVQPSVG
jgi:phosphatidylinositol alpha 1,6-mannosyltransferase